MKSFVGVGIAAVAVIAMSTGCSDGGTTSVDRTVPESTVSGAAATQTTHAAGQTPNAQPAPETQPAPEAHAAPSATVAAGDASPAASPAQAERASDSPTANHGYCLDINSEGVADAFGTLTGTQGSWAPNAGTLNPIGSCPSLMWMTAETSGGTVSSPTHVLFFTGDGKYLGTATQNPTAWTHVVGSTDNSVSVQYKWLTDDEPNCCPQGGPLTVTYTLDGSQVTPDKALPPEVHA